LFFLFPFFLIPCFLRFAHNDVTDLSACSRKNEK
jgi:hypothetical protein